MNDQRLSTQTYVPFLTRPNYRIPHTMNLIRPVQLLIRFICLQLDQTVNFFKFHLLSLNFDFLDLVDVVLLTCSLPVLLLLLVEHQNHILHVEEYYQIDLAVNLNVHNPIHVDPISGVFIIFFLFIVFLVIWSWPGLHDFQDVSRLL